MAQHSSEAEAIEVTSQVPSQPEPAKTATSTTNQHGGFSAEEFVRYEHMLKPKERESTGNITILETEKSFKAASSLEDALSSTTHSRHLSSTTISTACSTMTVPDKRQSKLMRNVRHTSFNVYRRLFSLVFIANMIGLIVLLSTAQQAGSVNLSHVATASSANILVAIMIRQDYIVNLLFRTCWLVPLSAPLRIRRMLAKIYEHGGVHSGAAVAGTIWFMVLTALITRDFVLHTLPSIPVITIAYVLLVLFISIIVLAYPAFRFKSHNTFENTHRFAGWLSIGLFWAELILFCEALRAGTTKSLGDVLITEPTFWFLIIITFHIILPWLRLRKITVRPEKLSKHALRVHFPMTLKPFSGIAISDSPLKEWHPFATFPATDGSGKGGSLIISHAGDWTRKTIDNPKTQYWIKGVPKTGVLSMACIFRSCVIVTTGSGIGPCLSILVDPSRKTQCRVLWSAPGPLQTFGQEIVDTVKKVDEHAVIWDTKVSGRPDMVAITYQLYIESGAEAIFIISNPKLTRKVVYGMESRGVPAFGPIWDS